MGSALPRFSISSADLNENQARLSGAELHHLRDVLRLRPGDRVELIDEHSRHATGVIERIGAGGAVIRMERVEPPRETAPLILALAAIKGPRMDFAIEKAAELGATEIWPLLCARCVALEPGPQRLARWRRLAAAASKQSRAAGQVKIAPPLRFDDFLTRIPTGVLAVICQPGGVPLPAVMKQARAEGILIACGPEGDFSPEEVAAAQRAGLVSVNLGANRLRTETAALAAVAIAASLGGQPG